MHDQPDMHFYVNIAGGHFSFLPVQKPAWGFKWAIDSYPLDKPFAFKGRIIYTKYESDEKILERYNKWTGEDLCDKLY